MPRLHVYPACVRRTMDTWNFGQILPVLLSITPFYNVLKHYFRERNPLKAILTRGRKSLDGESRRDTPRSPETEPESQSNLSALFIDLDSSCRAAGASENNLPGIGTRRTDEEALAALHQRIYSLTWFRNLLTLLCILVVGIVAAHFVEATIAFVVPARPFTWCTKDWHLMPVIVAGFAVFLILFLVSLLVPFFSRPLSA